MKTLVLTVILILIAGAGLAPVLGPPRAAGQSPPMRFDNVVRDDFFAGLAGDAARFERAMRRCEDELAKDPRHAQALVWHGAGLSFRAGQAAQRSDIAAARDLSTRGLREMDEAVALAPGTSLGSACASRCSSPSASASAACSTSPRAPGSRRRRPSCATRRSSGSAPSRSPPRPGSRRSSRAYTRTSCSTRSTRSRP